MRWAESRLAKPRSFLRKGRFSCFSLVRKEPKVHQRFANLWTPGTIQSSAGSNFAENSGGTCRNRFYLQNAGVKALNRCERVTVVQTQDRCFSKNSCFTASSQQVFADKICDCSLALLRWEIEFCCVDKKLFFFGLLCMSRKNAFFANQENFISRKLYELHSKPFFTHKNLFCMCLSSLSAKNSHFHKPKALHLHTPFLFSIQNTPFPPSTSHSHHP